MADAPIENPPPTHERIGSADRYCRSCLYCLGDLTTPGGGEAAAVCSECGTAFDRDDPRSTLPGPKRRKPWLLRWPAFVIVGLLALIFLNLLNALPVPMAGGSGALWQWRHSQYGYTEGLWWWAGDAYGSQTEFRGDLEITVSLHAGIARKVIAIDANDGHHAFTIERRGKTPVWSLRIDDHDLAWPQLGVGELTRAFNLTREHRFGVTVYTPLDTPRLTPPGPIVVSGTEADVFWAYVRAYGLVTDLPELVPRTTDGWHPTLEPGQTVEYPRPRATGSFRSREGRLGRYNRR